LAGERERLLAELQRTVQSVRGAVDEAAADMLAAATAEAGRRTDEAASHVERVIDARIVPMRRLSAELASRATALDREVGRLSTELADLAQSLRTSYEDPARPATPAPAPPAPGDPPADFGASELDRIEATRASIADTLTELSPRRRRFPPSPREGDHPEVPAGVRVVVDQMRMAGESDEAISRQLERMGVEDPAAVLAWLRPAQ
jgi:hypothetical protein